MACDECQEQRSRRLAAEAEFADYIAAESRRVPAIRYVERKVYTPMPPREIVRRIYYPHTVTVAYPVEVDRIVVERRWAERPAGFFGRLGDRIDKFLGGA